MKNNFTQQEILLMTTTAFASREYSQKDGPDNSKNLTGNEKLKDACWNGLIKEMLPELFFFNDQQAKLYLWQVREANHFFALEMSESATGVDKYFSVDPYRFMEVKEYN